MDQDTRPAPFNVGDHLRYVGKAKHTVPSGKTGGAELVLTPGMVGVVILSTGDLAGPDGTRPWHIQLQFPNGYHFDVTPQNAKDFEVAPRGEGSPAAGQS